ncbi:MAG: radical SAM protein, partial [Armatimonadota bacterium]
MYKTKVCLIQASNQYDVQCNSAIGFGYIKAYAEKVFGDDVTFFCAHNLNEIINFKPDILGISCLSQDFEEGMSLARQAQACGFENIIFGGHHITAFPETLPNEAVLGVIGEGEKTFTEILDRFISLGNLSASTLSSIKGIVYRDNEGKIIKTPCRDEIENLDDLPMPDRYFGMVQGQSPYIFSSRGCPYRCSFCASSRYWKGVRYHSAKRVVEEIEDILEKFPNIPRIMFYDDLLAGDKKRLKEIVDIIEEKEINKRVKFGGSVRANLVNDELCILLKRAGFEFITFGAESGSEKILKKLKNDSCGVDINQRALDTLNKHGLACGLGFVVGHYDEKIEDILDTYNFILNAYSERKISSHEINILTPMPGTE